MALSQNQMQEKNSVEGTCNELLFRPSDNEKNQFRRADLIFTNVDHSGLSYEVRVYLNNQSANKSTPRSAEEGYAGRYIIFGHGGCFGETGHCAVPTDPKATNDLRPVHPLTPQKKIVTITHTLKHILDESPDGLETVTLVPVVETESQEDQEVYIERVKSSKTELRIYD